MFNFITRMSRTRKIVWIVALIAIALIGSHFKGSDSTETDEIARADRGVSLSSVAELSLNTSPLPLLGTVTSRSEANIRAESSGKLVAVYKKLGDYVGAGQIIAEFENSSERASLLQAQGAYEIAQSSQGIAKINRGSADQSLDEVKTQTLNAITSAYTTLDDTIRTKTDSVFRNPQTTNPILTVNMSDSNLSSSIPQQRSIIENMLKTREIKNKSLSVQNDLVLELDAVEIEIQTVKNYLDDLALGMSRAIADSSVSQTTIDGYKTSIGLARTTINGLLSSVSTSRNTLKATIAANAISEKNFAQNGSTQTATADAGVKAALGTLNAAQSRLDKTIVRSPISGTINSLSVETGDFVSPFGEIAVVSNNGALEILAYANDVDAKVLKVGSKVVINDSISGVITRIASALDPKTKKIEVRIGISGSSSGLINGETVRIAAARSIASPGQKSSVIQIPLSALKITPTGSIVFTVSSSSKLVAHPVKEGTLLGSKVVITEGLTPDMIIVTDARGLKDGASVTVIK